jgi:hypothetical protein
VSALDEILARFGALPKDQQEAVVADAFAATKDAKFIPNPGPQEKAWFSKADELFYGGAAGAGKSALLAGLAVENHTKSIIFRREYPQIRGLVDEVARILGTREGYNGQDRVWKLGGDKVLEFGSVQHEDDKEKYQGRAHDFKGFDEITAFTESQYRFLIGWARSTKDDQRVRIVCAGNPPMTSEGAWVIKYWGPWLDPTHPNPAKPGELRWFTTIDGKDVEVDGRGPHEIDGRVVTARSRTFIPGKLEDNPELLNSGYAATLEAMPEPMRTMLREGRFDVAARDADFQVIPTRWIIEAQNRWSERPPATVTMTAMGFDPAGGGSDQAVIAYRYGGWFGNMVAVEGADTADGSSMAALVMKHRRDNAPVVVDMGGGYGGAVSMRFDDNSIAHTKFNGATASSARTKDGTLSFVNRRAEAWWKCRDELDPDQPGGSVVALPPDPELRADLAAPTWSLRPNGILIESKDDLRKRLGRSPGKGDAVVLALAMGDQAIKRQMKRGGAFGQMPQVNIGHAAVKQRYKGR